MPSEQAMKVWREAQAARRANCRTPGLDEDDGNQAAAAVIERAIAEAVEQERARIVAWLRSMPCVHNNYGGHFALRIERGDHKERADG